MRRGPRGCSWGRLAVMFGISLFLAYFFPPRLVIVIAALLLIAAGGCSWRC